MKTINVLVLGLEKNQLNNKPLSKKYCNSSFVAALYHSQTIKNEITVRFQLRIGVHKSKLQLGNNYVSYEINELYQYVSDFFLRVWEIDHQKNTYTYNEMLILL